MAKVTLHSNDIIILEIDDEDATVYLFGNDFLEDYGIEIPDELLERYNKNRDEFLEIQKELEKLETK